MRGKRAVILLAVPIAFLVATLVVGCSLGRSAEGKTRVAADIVPLAMICREVGGDHVEVEVLVPPGSSPHTYELSAGQIGFLAKADLLVVNGLGLVPWAENIPFRVGRPDLVVVEAAGSVPSEELLPAASGLLDGWEDEEGEGAHRSELYDPHLWLDPLLALHIVDAVEDGLARVDPENSGYYREKASELRARIAALHEEVFRRTKGFTHREFISFHSGWTYFARRYGLLQVGVIEELPGKEPSAGKVAALVELARSRGVRAVFAEEQFNPRVAEAVAEETGGEVRVWTLDPLGDLEDPERGDYCSLIRYNLDIMEEALR